MESGERIRRLKAALAAAADPARPSQDAALLAEMTPQDGALLAREALAGARPDHGGHELLRLACLAPGSLRDVHAEILDRGMLYPGAMYLGASPDVRDR